MLVISELLPKVHDLQTSLNKANTTPAIIDFLASANLSHVLPHTPSVTPRRFIVSHGGFSSGRTTKLTTFAVLVVRCIDNMASFSHMGRGVCSRYDPSRHLEWDKRSSVLCQTPPNTREGSDHGDSDKRDWWTVGKGWSGGHWHRS